MGFLRGNILLRFCMAVFAFVQMAAVVPHHHHGVADVPCINPLHALEVHSHNGVENHRAGNCGGDDCVGHFCMHNASGHGHSHEGSEGECTYTHLDLNPPTRDRIAFIPPVIELTDIITLCSAEPSGEVCHEHRGDGGVLCCSIYEGTIALYTHICTTAIPQRAPSFTV